MISSRQSCVNPSIIIHNGFLNCPRTTPVILEKLSGNSNQPGAQGKGMVVRDTKSGSSETSDMLR
jgi:hypothetical protein